MNSLGLDLFYQLCEVGTALQNLRETCFDPNTDEWLWHTEVIAKLDAAIDALVRSSGLGGSDDDA